MGLEAILACQEHLSYNQKRRVIEHVLKNECDLGVEELSWKHCILYLYVNGCITQEQYDN